MKKFTAFLSAAAISAGLVSAFNAVADDNTNYVPKLYFKAVENNSADILPSGQVIYINTNKTDSSSVSGKIEIYLEDKLKYAGQIVVSCEWENGGIEVCDVNTPEDLGTDAPYDDSKSAYTITKLVKPEQHFFKVSYQNIHSSPLVPTGETSDAYPLAVFDYSVSQNIGRYAVSFKTEQPNVTNIAYRYPNGDIGDMRPNGDNAKSIYITVNDRELGDVDGNGIINAIDASAALTEYVRDPSNTENALTEAERLAADVDGDGKITSMDASAILSYYVSEDDISFIEFLRNNS